MTAPVDCVAPDRSPAELTRLRATLAHNGGQLRRAADHYSLLAGETDIIEVVPFDSIPQIEDEEGLGALTRGGEPGYRRRMAFKSIGISAFIFIGFGLVGDYILQTLGVSVDAFKIAGGLLLFMLAVDMVFARQSGLRSATVREQDEARYRQDISVFPMAFPLIAGPGSLATLLLFVVDARDDWIQMGLLLGVILAVLLLTLILLPILYRRFGVEQPKGG